MDHADLQEFAFALERFGIEVKDITIKGKGSLQVSMSGHVNMSHPIHEMCRDMHWHIHISNDQYLEPSHIRFQISLDGCDPRDGVDTTSLERVI